MYQPNLTAIKHGGHRGSEAIGIAKQIPNPLYGKTAAKQLIEGLKFWRH